MRVKNKFTRFGLWLTNHRPVLYLLLYTWGIVWTAVGLIWSILMLLTFHKPHKHKWGWYFISWFKGGWGFEFGNCFMVAKDVTTVRKYTRHNNNKIVTYKKVYISNELHDHEIGHVAENAILGPFILLFIIIGIIRYWVYNIGYRKNPDRWSYDNYNDLFWYERYANAIGTWGDMNEWS